MPIYEYYCKKCDKVIDITKNASEVSKEEKCEKCNTVLTRIFSTPGINFKGRGFYSNDKRIDDATGGTFKIVEK